jgi:hypothetical protein
MRLLGLGGRRRKRGAAAVATVPAGTVHAREAEDRRLEL